MRPEDADDVVAMQQDGRFVEVFGHRSSEEHVRKGVAHTVEHWDQLGYGLWTLRDRESGAFVGRGGVQPVTIDGVDEVELGFEGLDLPSIVAFTLPTNVRSRRVMEKLGFTFERDIIWSELPHVLYRLRREEWLLAGS